MQYIQSVVHIFYAFSKIRGGGGDEFSLRFIVLLLHGLLCVISVMSDFSLDDPGFKAPSAPPPAPPLSDSSSETLPDVRCTYITCPRRMSKKTADRHTLCVSCRGFDYDIDTRCEECMEWPEEEVRLYAKYRKSLNPRLLRSRSLLLRLLLLPTPCPLRSLLRTVILRIGLIH